MEKQNKIQGFSSKPWILVGILLLIVSIGTVGCSSSKATTAQSTNQEQATQGQTNQGQPGQGQRVRNPALTAAMEIRRLENDQQNPLTSDQKEKLKPILQELINTPNASQDILQQKADAINAVFTDQQKSSLTTRRVPMEIAKTLITQMKTHLRETTHKGEQAAEMAVGMVAQQSMGQVAGQLGTA
ncbi:hypothetical protein [Desulfosporosinus sp. OT]|uniref:hypothetical protein n=1 Tax=Desulfosporosinus sp. OT TaxID=913865 RepID=UPI000223A1E5|nr:hypothetical protein [Desulfosporosinus sp. OT]EGW37213.1 putative lipoprotein [Desulfosporosinus sp. OT]